MNLIESARNLFKPIMPEVVLPVVPPKTPKPPPPKPGILLPGVDEYEEIDKAHDALKYPSHVAYPHAQPPMTMMCSTAEVDYPIQPMTELKHEPLKDWECEWCGNMWANDIRSCEKCGGLKGKGDIAEW